MNGKIAPLVFVDLETTGLNPLKHHAWEVGVISREPRPDGTFVDHEWSTMIALDEHMIAQADQRALTIGHFERYREAQANGYRGILPRFAAVNELSRLLSGAIVAGAKVWFDASLTSIGASFMSALFASHGQKPPWRYELVDVESYAAGAIGAEPPWNLDDLLQAYGITCPAEQRHTALGDARIERTLYDAARHLRERR